jgi:hypothetical protein
MAGLRDMTEQQNKVYLEIEKINNKVTDECDKLWGQLELLKNLNKGNYHSNSVNTSDVMLDSCRTDMSGGHPFSNSRVNTSSVNGHINGGPQINGVNDTSLEGGQPCCSPNNVVTKDIAYNNNWEFVRGTVNNTLDLAFPIFEGLPEQNAQAHLNALMEFIQIKNIPPPLHLAVARRPLNGISVATWGDAIWYHVKTFDDFRKVFLDKFWSLPCQAKVRL